MPDIVHEFPVYTSPETVYEAVATPEGLDAWWTATCEGEAREGAPWALGFGPGFDWRARVVASEPGRLFALEMTEADDDWAGTTLRFELEPAGSGTTVRFTHAGWPRANRHHAVSAFCWAMYLRLLRRYLEHGEVVPYADRLDA